jgi:predicted SnoaL-like aldol condensation-catalyzing enzyme
MTKIPTSNKELKLNSVQILERNKCLAIGYYSMAVSEQDPARAVKTYVGDFYRQHNPFVEDDMAGFIKHFIALNEAVPHVERFVRVIADDDLVAMHVLHLELPETYKPAPGEQLDYENKGLVSMDLFRVNDDGKVIEHYDAMQWPPSEYDFTGTEWDLSHFDTGEWPARPTKPVSSHNMTDGYTEIKDRHKKDENKALVRSFVEEVLVGGKLEKLGNYFEDGQCIQHNPYMRDGVQGYIDGLKELTEVQGLKHKMLHRVLGEGNFVFTQSEAVFRGRTTAILEIFRIENGKIAEHWDVFWETIPEKIAHENTLF